MTSPLLIHFVGICGAGKSTLTTQLADAFRRQGLSVIATVDYDPNLPDHSYQEGRAFSRQLDAENNASPAGCPELIRAHTLSSMARWERSGVDVILVDRWYESYDNLPPALINDLEQEVVSRFRVQRVLLTVEDDDVAQAIRDRITHTKANRPEAWWQTGSAVLEDWVESELAYQRQYQNFCSQSAVPCLTLNTRLMDWPAYVAQVLESVRLTDRS